MSIDVSGDAEAVEAATVVVLRDGASGLEVLMLRRNARGHFGGMWVFPGGRVDPEDRAGGTDGAGDALHAFRRAAVRETREEAGVALDPASLVHLSHWLPPPARRVRFSTHFFVAPLGKSEETVTIDGAEIVDHAWTTATDALVRRDSGEIELVTPTFVTLTWLAGHGTVDAALAAVEPRTYHTRAVDVTGGRIALYHGDAAYDSGDLDAPGPRRRANMLDSGWTWEEHDGH